MQIKRNIVFVQVLVYNKSIYKLGFIGEKIVKKRFRGILKNPPITPKLSNRFFKINFAQIVLFGTTKQHITILLIHSQNL